MVAGTARWQLIFKAAKMGGLHGALSRLLGEWKVPSGVRIETDVDPVNLM